jgi:hypothetical protein
LNKKFSYLLIALILAMAIVVPASAQFGIGTSNPDPSAALDIVSTDQGVLHPRLTTAQRDAISSPAEGLTIYNTTDKCLQVWDGAAWNCAVGGSGSEGGSSSSTLGANTSIPNVFVSDALRRIFGAWNNTTKDWEYTNRHDQFWIDDNTFGIIYRATASPGSYVPFIKLYDANFSLIREFAVTVLADPGIPYGTVATGLNNGNIVIY